MGEMVVIIRSVIVCLFFLFATAKSFSFLEQNIHNKPQLLLIETAGQDQYYYRNMILIAQSVGFQVTFKNFYDIISDDHENDSFSNYDALFFLTSIDLLKNLKHDLSQKFIKILEDLKDTQNKLIGFFTPATAHYHPILFQIIESMVNTMGVFDVHNEHLKPTVQKVLQSLLQGDGQKGALYSTTLINKTVKKIPLNIDLPVEIDNKQSHEVLASLMPITQHFSPLIKRTLPAGIYIKNKTSNNIFFISKVSEFTFADVAENFFKTPIHLQHRQELLMVAQQMMHELYHAYMHGNMPISIKSARPPLPKKLTLKYMRQEKKRVEQMIGRNIKHNSLYNWILDNGISCAWQEPNDFELYEDTSITKMDEQTAQQLKSQALESGIQFTHDAHMNLLWFEFNAELYLSEHGLSKNNRQMFINRVTNIAQTIKKQYQKSDQPFPKIFIGTDITSNFKSYPVKHPVQDVFGNTLDKIPSPLDMEHFWQPELIDIFNAFYNAFHTILPITGVFLDFEMYHAQHQTGAYTSTMDFSTPSWQAYCVQQDKNICVLKSVTDRVNYLIKHKEFKHYFQILESQAFNMGKQIKEKLRKIMPTCIIGAYAMTLPSSWFYRGIMAGLSSKKEPLLLATFNTDVYSHTQWLENHNIHIIHGAPILLSKLQTQKDFELIKELQKYHYFVWYLRPSRMVYSNKHSLWWSSEASSLNPKYLAQEIANATK